MLIHAGSGGVGTAAIQLAKHWKAYVVTTASGANEKMLKARQVVVYAAFTCLDLLVQGALVAHPKSHGIVLSLRHHWLTQAQDLGADEVVDYKSVRFEERYRQSKFDVVVDTIGGASPSGPAFVTLTVQCLPLAGPLPRRKEASHSKWDSNCNSWCAHAAAW